MLAFKTDFFLSATKIPKGFSYESVKDLATTYREMKRSEIARSDNSIASFFANILILTKMSILRMLAFKTDFFLSATKIPKGFSYESVKDLATTYREMKRSEIERSDNLIASL